MLIKVRAQSIYCKLPSQLRILQQCELRLSTLYQVLQEKAPRLLSRMVVAQENL